MKLQVINFEALGRFIAQAATEAAKLQMSTHDYLLSLLQIQPEKFDGCFSDRSGEWEWLDSEERFSRVDQLTEAFYSTFAVHKELIEWVSNV